MDYLDYALKLDLKPASRKISFFVIAAHADNETGICCLSVSMIRKCTSMGLTQTKEALNELLKIGHLSKLNSVEIMSDKSIPNTLKQKLKEFLKKPNQNFYKINIIGKFQLELTMPETDQVGNRLSRKPTRSEMAKPTRSVSDGITNNTNLLPKTPLKGGKKVSNTPPSESLISEELILNAQSAGYQFQDLKKLFQRVVDRAITKQKPYETHEQVEAAVRIALQDDWLELRKEPEPNMYDTSALLAWELVSGRIEMMQQGYESDGMIGDETAHAVIMQLGGIQTLHGCEKAEIANFEEKFKSLYGKLSKRR